MDARADRFSPSVFALPEQARLSPQFPALKALRHAENALFQLMQKPGLPAFNERQEQRAQIEALLVEGGMANAVAEELVADWLGQLRRQLEALRRETVSPAGNPPL